MLMEYALFSHAPKLYFEFNVVPILNPWAPASIAPPSAKVTGSWCRGYLFITSPVKGSSGPLRIKQWVCKLHLLQGYLGNPRRLSRRQSCYRLTSDAYRIIPKLTARKRQGYSSQDFVAWRYRSCKRSDAHAQGKGWSFFADLRLKFALYSIYRTMISHFTPLDFPSMLIRIIL
jgi:hypothetical protein